MLLRHRAGDHLQRLAEAVVRIRHRRLDTCPTDATRSSVGHRLPAPWCRRTTGAAGRPARATRCSPPRRALERGFGAGVRAGERIGLRVGIAATPTPDAWQRVRRVARRRPRGERIERRPAAMLEIAAEPARCPASSTGRRGPDVGAGEMRAARVLVADALNERELALIEDVAAARSAADAARAACRWVAADLQHGAGGNAERRTAAVIEGSVYGTSVLRPSLPPARSRTTRLRLEAPCACARSDRNAGAAKLTVNAATPFLTKVASA